MSNAKRRRPAHRTAQIEYRRLSRDYDVAVQAGDRVSRQLRDLAYTLEITAYRRERRWHRSQMVGAR